MTDILISAAITAAAMLSLALTIIGLPGNWVMAAIAAAMTFYAADSQVYAMSPLALGCVLALAVLGEVIETAAGAAGVKRLGGSRRAAVLAIAGSMIGAIAGLFIGSPVPVIGSVIVSLLLGGVGAAVGASLGEKWAGRRWGEVASVGYAAFWGRLLGTVGKLVCAATIAAVVTAAAWLHGSV